MNVITSFSEKGYEMYGKRFVETFLEHWPESSKLTIYAETPLKIDNDRVEVVDLFKYEGVTDFLSRIQNSDKIYQGVRPGKDKDGKQVDMYDYRYDAYRFCRKVFAMTEFASRTEGKFMWLDADIITHTDVPETLLDDILPDDKFTAYLGREWAHSETGFIAFNMKHEQAALFMGAFDNAYKSGSFRFLGEWHDCYVFDMIRELLDIEAVDLAEGMHMEHPFVNTVLGKYMDHLKGPERKKAGKSHDRDVMVDHKVPYWRKSA